MESSERRRKLIELGSILVAELDQEGQADTLSRWMSHYVAELIITAEQSAGPDKAAAEERCFQTILTLWSRRETLPRGSRPLEEFEPILNALARLDPENPVPLWHSLSHKPAEEGEPSEVNAAIGFIFSLDQTARELIDVALGLAVDKANKPATRIYLSAAIPAAAESSSSGSFAAISEMIRRFCGEKAGTDDASGLLARRRAQIEQLRKHRALCEEMENIIQSEVDAIQVSCET